MSTLIPTIHHRLYDHGYGKEPLFVIDTAVGYFSHWLDRKSGIAVCETDWMSARKYKTFEEANCDFPNLGRTAVIKRLVNA